MTMLAKYIESNFKIVNCIIKIVKEAFPLNIGNVRDVVGNL